MSSNIIINKQKINNNQIINSYNLNKINKKSKQELIKNLVKVPVFSKNKKNLLNLESTYKTSLTSLEIIKKQTEKNINNIINKKCNENFNNLLVKKNS